jgi:hypothetical protein
LDVADPVDDGDYGIIPTPTHIWKSFNALSEDLENPGPKEDYPLFYNKLVEITEEMPVRTSVDDGWIF